MKKTVYIETTIPSYYYETRKSVRALAWREATRKWWKNYRKFYNPIISEFVLFELERGHYPAKKEKFNLVKNLESLSHLAVIDDIVDEYIKNQLVPREFGGDAFHLAYASYYGVDFLLTWNCNNLANPNKFHHMNVINNRLKINTPIICTPIQLLTGEEV